MVLPLLEDSSEGHRSIGFVVNSFGKYVFTIPVNRVVYELRYHANISIRYINEERRSESDLRSCEATVAKKVQKKF